ncbi:PQQ-binding-like beta-propeller repeat protein [Kitasatospora sp. NPDC057936]|uniref:outer membrane protein assembly factor BamB family protein n=1 Tax=Kitasatospora sp. NPDC057936 TaxID=3346283 RepID=UPI0036DBD47A
MINDAVPLSVDHDAASGLWTVTAPKDSLGPIAVADGQVLVPFDGRMTAFDARDGGMLWRSPHPLGGTGLRLATAFTTAGQHVVVPSRNPSPHGTEPIGLTCLRRTDGALAWIRDAAPLSGYLADGRTLVLWQSHPDAPRHVTAVDLVDGRRLWRHDYVDFGSVLLTQGRVIVTVGTQRRHYTRAYDARSGKQLWRTAMNRYPARLHLVAVDHLPGPVVFTAHPRRDTVQWFDPATGTALGSLTTGYPSTRWRGAGTDGEVPSAAWARVDDRRVAHLRPLGEIGEVGEVGGIGEGRVRTFFSPRRPLRLSDPQVVEVAGRLYTTVRLDGTHDDPAAIRGERIVSARLGGRGRPPRLTGLRWPLKVPRRERRNFYAHLVPAPGRLYALLIHRAAWAVVAVRGGRVLWRRGSRATPPVPLGDRVLLLDDCGEHDHLRLVDGRTGATTRPCPRK